MSPYAPALITLDPLDSLKATFAGSLRRLSVSSISGRVKRSDRKSVGDSVSLSDESEPDCGLSVDSASD